MAQRCVKGCLAVAEGKKWPYVADKSVYEHEKWKGADWAEVKNKNISGDIIWILVLFLL